MDLKLQTALVAVPAFLLSLAATWLILKRTPKLGLDDAGSSVRKAHEGEISRLGGLPIFIALLAVFAICQALNPTFLFGDGSIEARGTPTAEGWWPVLVCCSLIFILGFLDDLHPLGAKVKFLGQIGVALIAWSLDIRIHEITNPFGPEPFKILPISVFVTVFWFVAITNIVNLIDGMDGLATGLGTFLCVTMGLIPLLAGSELASSQIQGVGLLAFGMAAALLGFLKFNFPPARIFLGDGGAYLIGFFIASVSIQSSYKGSVVSVLMVVMIALGLPILDTAFAIARRGVRGLPLFRADAEHIHHRLLTLGLSKNAALLSLYAVCGVLSLLGLSVFWKKGFTLPIVGAVVVILALLSARFLGYVGRWGDFRAQLENALGRRKDVQYALLHGHLLEVEAERIESEAEFWDLFDDAMTRIGLSRTPKSGFQEVRIEMGQSEPWVLHVPPDSEQTKAADWKALAECLASSYNRARNRWGTRDSDARDPQPSSTAADPTP